MTLITGIITLSFVLLISAHGRLIESEREARRAEGWEG